jgi:hypothetical protein
MCFRSCFGLWRDPETRSSFCCPSILKGNLFYLQCKEYNRRFHAARLAVLGSQTKYVFSKLLRFVEGSRNSAQQTTRPVRFKCCHSPKQLRKHILGLTSDQLLLLIVNKHCDFLRTGFAPRPVRFKCCHSMPLAFYRCPTTTREIHQ